MRKSILRTAAPLAVAAVGSMVTAMASLLVGMSASEGLHLLAVAGGAALLGGVLGALVLTRLRGHRIGVQVTAVALTVVGSVGGGALAAAKAMFLSAHDLEVLVVVLLAASTVAVAAGLALGGRVARDSLAIEEAARFLGEGGPADGADSGERRPNAAAGSRPAAGELASLARQLEETSQRLDQSRRHERALDASRRELVAWVSHDLRTPLAGIRAMAEALEDGVVDDRETIARYYRTLRQEADRLALLVDDLFELSRIQAGALQMSVERASLGDVVSDALAVFAPLAQAKGVRLEGRMCSVPPELDLSTPDVARALRNLLENAIRHTPSDGSVTVDLAVEADRAVVSVADACGGIPAEDLEMVFEPAFRGESARTPVVGEARNGTARGPAGGGFGLAIVRGIVEAHQGEVSVHNEDSGCRFVVRLPLVSAG